MVLLDRGILHQAQGQDGAAIRTLSRAINLIPAYRQRAALFDAAGEKARAEADRKEVGSVIADLAR